MKKDLDAADNFVSIQSAVIPSERREDLCLGSVFFSAYSYEEPTDGHIGNGQILREPLAGLWLERGPPRKILLGQGHSRHAIDART